MDVQRRQARTAGLIYLVVAVTGIISVMVIPARYSVAGDAAATLANIAAMDTLFRLGIAINVLSSLAFLVLPLALHRLLAPVDRELAAAMVVFVAVGATIGLVSAVFKLNVLAVMGGAPYLDPLTSGQRAAQAMLSLRAYTNLNVVAELFWGVWLLPFGLLVYRSGFLPRVLGVLLVAGSFGYAIDSLGRIISPAYASSTLAVLVPAPAHVGEIGTLLWLIIVGTTRRRA
jgi:hypothetical protein